MIDLIGQIKKLSSDYFDDVKAIRQHIHAHPELSFKEFDTADFIEGKLRE